MSRVVRMRWLALAIAAAAAEFVSIALWAPVLVVVAFSIVTIGAMIVYLYVGRAVPVEPEENQ